MIKIQGSLDREVFVATSGGVDSMSISSFLSRSHQVTMLFFDHGTSTSKDAKYFLRDFTDSSDKLTLKIGGIQREKLPEESQEEYWRNERYRWFHSFSVPIITGHHLDDCVETWIWSSLHGEGKIIPYSNKNVIRPFRLNRKEKFYNWCRRNHIPWLEDSSNSDTKYMRNYIRQELVEKCLMVNPGLHTVIRKKVLNNE